MIVIKRDGTKQGFDVNKVRRAILASFSHGSPDISALLSRIVDLIIQTQSREINVEDVGNICLGEMVASGFTDEAEAFARYRNERTRLRENRLDPNTKLLQEYIHASKYAKGIETWSQTVRRYASTLKNNFYTDEMFAKAIDHVLAMKVLPSMRGLQFGGHAIETINERIYNCSFTLIDRTEVFARILYLLLSGCGVGYSVQKRHVLKLPKVLRVNKRTVRHVKIPDDIEGWAKAVNTLTYEMFYGGSYVEFDYSSIRREGSPLITSGGVAPGHLGLKASLEKLRNILEGAAGRQLRPIECHDMICGLAKCVLSGGIRRASLSSLFDSDDLEMFHCKNNLDYEKSDRVLANNSVVIRRGRPDTAYLLDKIVDNSQECGEPGFFFTNNEDYGTNPCFEIGLNPISDTGETGFAFCNLTEINVSTCVDEADFFSRCESATVLGTLQAELMNFKSPVDKAIALRDRLLGVSLTGILDNPGIGLNAEVLRKGAEVVRWVNDGRGARLTCVKPSGTASLLLGCVGSGVHPHHARRYFRRVTANPNERAAKIFRKYNPHMVFVRNNGDWALTFPIKTRDDAILVEDCKNVDFLKIVKKVYDNWVLPGHMKGDNTHNVSATCVVDDMPAVKKFIVENEMTAVSFVPPMLDKIYPLAPREAVSTAVDEVLWNHLIKDSVPVDYGDSEEGIRDIGNACDGGKCEL